MSHVDLYHGDVVDTLRGHFSDASVDIVVTSPPYNIGKDYDGCSDDRSIVDYAFWCEGWTRELARVVKRTGSIFVNIGDTARDPMTISWVVLNAASAHLTLQNTIIWVKSITVPDKTTGAPATHGHLKPVNSGRYLNHNHEFIFHFTHDGAVPLDRLAIGVPYADKSNMRRWKSAARDLRCRGNAWFIPYETIQSRALERPHPSPFPIELPRRCIKLAGGKPGMVVLDPFAGIGTTLFAARELGIDAVGIDTGASYLDIIRTKLQSENGAL